ncbi:MAG: tetratricopeptide repeat protein [Clostridium sp.]|nr:tetratricopeptide repeat protein [Clostridium sp.]
MNVKSILSGAFICAALAASADGYQDGIEYFKAGQYANAKEILERNMNAAGTDKAMSYYYLGQIDLKNGDRTAAKANFDKGIAANPECAYNYIGLGAIDLLNGNKNAAEDQFKAAQKYDKKDYEILVDIARAYYNADPVKYDKELNKMLDEARKKSKYKEPSIYILEGDMLYDAKDLGGAAGKYEQAITYEVDNPEGYVKYANAYMGVNPQFGVQKLEELLSKQPNSALAQRELAEKYYETSQWTKAAQQYGKYIQNPNHFPEDKARYAVLLYANSEYQKSLDVANELLSTDPNNFVMNRIRVLDLAEMKNYPEAIAAAEKFFTLTPKDKETFSPIDYTTYASCLSENGQDSLAIFQYEKAVELNPARADNWKLLSTAYNNMKNYQKAAEAYQSSIDNSEDPSLNDYYIASGRWQMAAGSTEDAEQRKADAAKGLEDINKVIESAASEDADFLRRKAILQFLMNDKAVNEDVRDSYMKVIEILDADPANADPANAKNKIKLYQEAYLYIGNFYQNTEDPQYADTKEDLQREAYEKSDYYKSLLQK